MLARFTGVRTCTTRLGRSALHRCPEREVAPCPAPQGATPVGYAAATARAADLIEGADSGPLTAMLAQITELAARTRYESAARLRDHAATTIETLWRGQRLRALEADPRLVPLIHAGRLLIQGAHYSVDTGEVSLQTTRSAEWPSSAHLRRR